MIARVTLVVGLLAVSASSVSPQDHRTLTGFVTRRSDGQPVVGAQVVLQHARVSAWTDETGKFVIPALPPATYTLIVRCAGFAELTQRNVSVRDQDVAHIDLRLDPLTLPVQQKAITGLSEALSGVERPFTVARLGPDRLQVTTGGSALMALAGKIPGVSVIRHSQPVESDLAIGLRTVVSVTGALKTDPLLVLDGIPLTGTDDTDIFLDPTEIESIEVLKGAAAAAAYGSRGGSGVIAITTKRAQLTPAGETRVSYGVETSMDGVTRPLPRSRYHYYRVSADGSQFVDQGGNPVGWSDRTFEPPGFADAPYPGPLYDHFDALFRSQSGLHHNVSLTQSGPNTSLLLALNRRDQTIGVVSNQGYWRNQARFTLQHRAGDALRVVLNGLYSSSWRDEISGYPYDIAMLYPSFVDLTARGANGLYLPRPDSAELFENPLWRQQVEDFTTEQERAQAGASLNYSARNWLAFDAQLGYERARRDTRQFMPRISLTEVMREGLLNLTDYRAQTQHVDVGALIRHRIGGVDLASRFSVGGRRTRIEQREAGGLGTRNSVLPADSAVQRHEIDVRHHALNLTANYDDRFLVDGLIRRDDASPHPGEEWESYQRAAASYRVTEEPWFRLPAVNELTFRLAWGVTSDELRIDPLSGILQIGNLLENPALRRPRTTELEFGITSVLLNNRLSVELAHAYQVTRDHIGVDVAGTTGSDLILANVATSIGQTWEGSLHARVIDRPGLSLDLAAVVDRSRSQVWNWNHWLGGISGFRHLTSASELPVWLQARAAEFQVNDDGYLVWVGAGNTYKDGVSKQLWDTSFEANGVRYEWGLPILLRDSLAELKRTRIGSFVPDLNYGFTTTLRWKNLSVLGEFRGQLGGQVYNDGKELMYRFALHPDVDQFGKPEELKKPIRYYYRGIYAILPSLPFVEDATYLKVGALSVQYRFQHAGLIPLLGRLSPHHLSIGLTGRNLLTLSRYAGDPEVGSAWSRTTYFDYPSLRTVSAKVDISF
jgi:TonB-dependent SusC/RagA subfamily outer membrane receptor